MKCSLHLILVFLSMDFLTLKVDVKYWKGCCDALNSLQNHKFRAFLKTVCALCSALSVWTWNVRPEDYKIKEIVMMCRGFSGIPVLQAEVKNIFY